ncbi:MAG: orotidine-5'-phosphate decarboxylase [Armatimonadota bacterium]|nr:orotidine-5'-phosphate decarboxylase [Armatimonadota bacterium]MDR7437198.1 orotidine-5'-phosphate decarboxylase [Armatimonadota bacterium]MDR7509091.1 orotidine-5'-phosphate decarboxylase [Armatimonadota bacterium]MDR7516014.1 orotidine-5'-phosphate decarboxylase [Armatimonadota bacterium]MDR7560418.1 orotidine-5'-phosphate decarboxylase [Armatimonadota bacterium]
MNTRDAPDPTSGRAPAVPRSRDSVLVVALDVPTLAEAEDLVDRLCGLVSWFKVGSELFTAAGPAAVRAVLDRGGQVFLDLKFHDIPRTVAAAVRAAADLGVSMMTVHVAAGDEALTRSARALRTRRDPPGRLSDRVSARPLLVGVTRLTSEPATSGTSGQIVEAALLSRRCGLDGVVAAAGEAAAIRQVCGSDFIIVTPGIRPAGTDEGDQARTATPRDAVRAGADYLVVGRPILEAPDPREAAGSILEEIEAALRQEGDAPPRKV